MIYVEYDMQSTHHYHSGEQWGDWSEDYSYSVTGVKVDKPSHYGYESIGINAEVGEVVHVVSIVYNTGDSFGTATGKGEVIWVFKDIENARSLKKEIIDNKHSYSINITSEEGKEFSLSNPASGYFESLGCVNIDTFVVE